MHALYAPTVAISKENEFLSIISRNSEGVRGYATQINEPFELDHYGVIYQGVAGSYIVQPEAGKQELIVIAEDAFNEAYNVFARLSRYIDPFEFIHEWAHSDNDMMLSA